MSFHSVTMSNDEAVKDLKAIKLGMKSVLAAVQADTGNVLEPPARQQAIARYQRHVDALKLAIVALGGTVSP